MRNAHAGRISALLEESPLVPVLRARREEHVEPTATALIDAGARTVELTLTTPGCLHTITRLKASFPQAVVGAGSVLSQAQAVSAAGSGADYLVTPITHPRLASTAHQLGIPILMGAFTPSEVARAVDLGAAAVKVFPAASGGPEHVAALKEVFGSVSLFPTGGVTEESAPHYLHAGASAVGIGGSWFRRSLDGDDDPHPIAAQTVDLLKRVRKSRLHA